MAKPRKRKRKYVVVKPRRRYVILSPIPEKRNVRPMRRIVMHYGPFKVKPLTRKRKSLGLLWTYACLKGRPPATGLKFTSRPELITCKKCIATGTRPRTRKVENKPMTAEEANKSFGSVGMR